jgi:hypothetical protein
MSQLLAASGCCRSPAVAVEHRCSHACPQTRNSTARGAYVFGRMQQQPNHDQHLVHQLLCSWTAARRRRSQCGDEQHFVVAATAERLGVMPSGLQSCTLHMHESARRSSRRAADDARAAASSSKTHVFPVDLCDRSPKYCSRTECQWAGSQTRKQTNRVQSIVPHELRL